MARKLGLRIPVEIFPSSVRNTVMPSPKTKRTKYLLPRTIHARMFNKPHNLLLLLLGGGDCATTQEHSKKYSENMIRMRLKRTPEKRRTPVDTDSSFSGSWMELSEH